MPEIAGHELPTPGNADSPKQRKRREEVIVIATLVLVVLTFVLVMRRNAANTAGDTSTAAFDPTDPAGAYGTNDPFGTLSQQIGALPGQIAALQQGQMQGLQGVLAQAGAAVGLDAHQLHLLHLARHPTMDAHQLHMMHLKTHPMALSHSHVPKHHIVVSHNAPLSAHQEHLLHEQHLAHIS